MAKDLILGIESSCDDTAAALVDRTGRVLSSVVAPQTTVHSVFGGVYPEFASRAHISSIVGTVERALMEANVAPSDLRRLV